MISDDKNENTAVISTSDLYWLYYCICETFRQNDVKKVINVEEFFKLIPFGIICYSVLIGNGTPVTEWAMEYLDYIYCEENEKWIKK